MIQEKHMIARIPADPKHCPKCGQPLVEELEPELHRIEGGSDVTIGGGVTFYCLDCQIFWNAHQIPDHYLYDPDYVWCPVCGREEKIEIDTVIDARGRITKYQCSKCRHIWNIKEY